MMIEARLLCVRRGAHMVLNDAGCALESGRLLAICGPNGAGKSSLLTAMAGLVDPASGEVLLDGRPLSSLAPRERARAIGFLPQHAEAAWDVSVRTLIGLGRLPWRAVPGRPARAMREADDAAIANAIGDMQLDDLADRPVSQLSGGERARAMMARVLAGEPRFLLADEPFASLDIGHARDLAGLLRLQASRGKGVAVVMHDLAMAMNHADRVIVLDQGRIVADDVPEQALDEAVISRVWNTNARWLGDRGARALAV
jgi:iron complex transport system ATP-binding protein